MINPLELRSYPKMIFGSNTTILNIEERIFNAALVVLDMAGTTIADEGAVLTAFHNTAIAMGVNASTPGFDQMMQYVKETMGQSKIEVFEKIFASKGKASKANELFEAFYQEQVTKYGISEIEGTTQLLTTLRSRGVMVALTTGFSYETMSLLLEKTSLTLKIDAAICPSNLIKGRPEPDMILQAMKVLNINDPSKVVVLGDTPSDIKSAKAAEATLVAGVLSGSGEADQLLNAGADVVLNSIADLATLFYAFGKNVL
ncbi:MAG: HAD-IA family hydrolase [Actinomycetota bacterium]|nr:HAD-IA family hydrolase [Actinomycetota bacterium]